MSDNQAKIEITASTARLPSALRAAGKMMQGFAESTASLFGSRFSGLLSGIRKDKKGETAGERSDRVNAAIGSFIGNTASNLALRGLDLMVNQGKEVLKFEDALVKFGIAAKQTPEQMRAIGNAARDTSRKTGLSAQGVLDAGRAYVDLAGAENFSIARMNLLARAAKASGSETKDLAGMMYQLTRSMKIVDDKTMEDTIGGLLNQAKEGGIEAAEMSREFAGLLPLYAQFGVTGRQGAVQAGAMFQVMRDGFNSASEAGTGLQRVYAGIMAYAPRFEAAHVQIYKKERDAQGRKVLLPFSVIFKHIRNSELMKDPALLKKAFGRTEAWRSMMLADKNIARLHDLEEAGLKDGVVMEDLARVTGSATGRIDLALEKMKNDFAAAMTPERVDTFANAIENASTIVSGLVWGLDKAAFAFSALVDLGHSLAGGKPATDESTVRDANNRRYRERVASIGEAFDRGQRKIHPGQTIADELSEDYQAKRQKVIDDEIRWEDILRGRLETQAKGGEISRPAEKFIGPVQEGHAAPTVNRGNFTEAELRALLVMTRNDSDGGLNQRLIQGLLDKGFSGPLVSAIRTLQSTLTDAIKSIPRPLVNIGGDTVRLTAGNAPSHRLRP